MVEEAEGAGLIDWATFDQILEMDDDGDEREFSKSIVWNFFEQAENTFTQMDDALASKNLDELSLLGHFLKGSSAALGLTLVKDSCEKIQHLGAKKDETGKDDVDDDELCLSRIQVTLEEVRKEYAESEKFLRRYFKDEGDDEAKDE
ncbi:signal transduction histidine kinase [Dipodascopsis tothii]|uniref:signal transduction histidine kinase n=1 Tax=Dipodascopsis tothii TaxID=44089 RepID=UPI0034CED40D